jgi:hypothetical protein
VNAAVHSPAEETPPFGITAAPLQPVIHVGSVIGPTIPVWDIAEQSGDPTNLLVTSVDQGRDLAQCQGQNQVALMRGHGFAAVGATIMDMVRVSVYLPVNARELTTARRFGAFEPLAPGGIANRVAFDPRSAASWRPWEYWARRAVVGELLGDMP